MYAEDLSIHAAVNNYDDYLKLQYDLNELCINGLKDGALT